GVVGCVACCWPVFAVCSCSLEILRFLEWWRTVDTPLNPRNAEGFRVFHDSLRSKACDFACLRISSATPTTTAIGSQIQTTSLSKARRPQRLKTARPIGDT